MTNKVVLGESEQNFVLTSHMYESIKIIVLPFLFLFLNVGKFEIYQ